jgi:hypothetical protein
MFFRLLAGLITVLQVQTRGPGGAFLGGDGVNVAFPHNQEDIAAHVNFNHAVGQEQHLVARFDGPDEWADLSDLSPQPASVGALRRWRNENAPAGAAVALLWRLAEDPVGCHADCELRVVVRIGTWDRLVGLNTHCERQHSPAGTSARCEDRPIGKR